MTDEQYLALMTQIQAYHIETQLKLDTLISAARLNQPTQPAVKPPWESGGGTATVKPNP